MAATTALGQMDRLRIVLLLTLAAAVVAERLHVPYTLGLVLADLALGVSHLLPGVRLAPNVVLFIFLPLLLFDGARKVDLPVLRADRLIVTLLAVPGLLLSVAVVAVCLHRAVGLSWLLALLVGAIVSPTDPLPVLALLQQLAFPVRLRTLVEGESLFNDGIGAALSQVFLALLLVGLLLGAVTAPGVRRLDDFRLAVTITLALAYGAYLLGTLVQTSGLLTVVGTGCMLGNPGRQFGSAAARAAAADRVWEVLAHLANSLLFLLLGVQIEVTHLAAALPATGQPPADRGPAPAASCWVGLSPCRGAGGPCSSACRG